MAYDPGLADRVYSILPRLTTFAEKKMFGGVAYMVNGKMCCGVVKSDLVLRLGPEGTDFALTQRHTRPMDFTGKPLKSMIYVEPAGTTSEEDLETWLRRAVDFARHAPKAPEAAVAKSKNEKSRLRPKTGAGHAPVTVAGPFGGSRS